MMAERAASLRAALPFPLPGRLLATAITKDGTLPSVVVKITSPDGREFKDNVVIDAGAASMSRERCDVSFGPHTLAGDFKTYALHVEKTDGENGSDGAGGTGKASPVGCELTLSSTSKPWRPGAGVTGLKPGDEVCAATLGLKGALAEYAVAKESWCARKPQEMSWELAAAVPSAGVTALSAVERIGPAGDVLVVGASGGVGQFALAFACQGACAVDVVCTPICKEQSR